MIEFRYLNLRDVLYVCENMRLQDWQEVMNLLPRGINTPEAVAIAVMSATKVGIIAVLDGVPCIVAQLSEVLDGSYRIGMFGTDDFRKCAFATARELLTNVMPICLEDGAKYCEAYSDATHEEAHKLLEVVGFRKCAILPGFGSRGRDIALFILTIGDLHVLRKRFKLNDNQHNHTAGDRSD